MRSIFFTKPKEMTLNCLKYLLEQNEELVFVVMENQEKYVNTEFVKICHTEGIEILNYSEAKDRIMRMDDIDMIYSNTYPIKIDRDIVQQAKKAAVNFHSAPLPEYKGVFGYNFAILNGEKHYGVTAHYLDDDFDTGNIIECRRFEYDCENGNLSELIRISDYEMFELFKKTYKRFANNEKIPSIVQQGGKYYSRRMFEAAKKINPDDSVEVMQRKIRAFWYPPFDGAYIEKDGARFTLVTQQQLSKIKKDNT